MGSKKNFFTLSISLVVKLKTSSYYIFFKPNLKNNFGKYILKQKENPNVKRKSYGF